jgi:hypothetical protein
MKMTSNGIQPLNIKSGMSQQPFIGSYSNFKLDFGDKSEVLKHFKLRWLLMEDDLKIFKV